MVGLTITTRLRLMCGSAAAAIALAKGPTMASTFASISSAAPFAAISRVCASSRTSSSSGRPWMPPAALRSSSASWTPLRPASPTSEARWLSPPR